MYLTLKLKINTDQSTTESLRETARQYTDSYNRVAAVGWEASLSNGVELHKLTYYDERKRLKLPSQLVCSARVRATESLKSVFAQRKKNQKNKVSQPISKRCPVRYDARSANIKLEKRTVSLATVDGRKTVDLTIPPCHRTKINLKVCGSDLYQNAKGKFFLNVVVEVPTTGFVSGGKVVGVDLGVKRLAVTSQNQFLGPPIWRSIEDRYRKLSHDLQSKGTKSARRHLRRLSGKVNRFRTNCDHVLAKNIVSSCEPGTIIAVEDLTDCRMRMKSRRKQRRRLHSWSFSRLQTFVEYKAKLAGCQMIKVDPRYTSQKCSRCSYINKGNRQSQSHFVCGSCSFQLNADLNAARNIRSNYLISIA